MRQLGMIFGILLLVSVSSAQMSGLPGAGLSLAGSSEPGVSAELNTSGLQPGQQAVLAVVVDIPRGYHAQSNTPSAPTYIKFLVRVPEARQVRVFDPIYPAGTDQDYPVIGRMNVYGGRVVVHVPIEVARDATGRVVIAGDVRYQICDDAGTCLPPETRAFSISATVVPLGQATLSNRPELFTSFDFSRFGQLAVSGGAEAGPASVEVDLFGWRVSVGQGSYGLWFSLALLAGVVLNVMPCVLPIVPLKAMSFYEASAHNRARGILLGAVFGAGVVVVFAGLAVLVVIVRAFDWGQQFSNPWFAGGISLVLLVFALQMFGLFSVLLPAGVYNWVPSQQTAGGNFAMGMFTAIVSTPCTFGVLVTLLAWAVRQPAWIGVLLVISVGVGMALPYFLLSAFPGAAKKVPRSGPWAEMVKQMLGFLVLASAVFFASPFIVPLVGDRGFWWLLFAIVASAGVFLVFRTMAFAKTARGIVAAVAVALLLIGPAAWGTLRLTRHLIDWQPYSDAALERAMGEGRTVIVKFTAAWCANCKVVEARVFGDAEVAGAVRRRGVVMLKADLTDENAPGRRELRTLDPVGAIPLTAIYFPPRRENPVTLAGIYGSDDLLKALASRDKSGELSESSTANRPK